MIECNIVLAVIFGAAAVVGGAETVYQIYKLTVLDAAARGLEHPKLWGLLAANGNNSSGLLLYLMQRRKKSAGIGLAFMAVGAIGFVLCLGALTT